VKPVNGFINEAAGRALGAFYANDRIIDGDGFFHRIGP
jgi:hypothetical protein